MSDRDDIDQHAGAVHRRDAAQIIRLVLLVAIIAALVALAFDNRADVRVGYLFDDADAPGWVVLIAAAAAGVVIGWLLRHRPRHRS